MQENGIRQGQHVFRGAPFQEREDLLEGRRAEGGAGRSQPDPSAVRPLDPVMKPGRGEARGGGVVEGNDDGAGQRVLAAELEDGGSDRDAARDYRSSPSRAKRWSTDSMSPWMVSAGVPPSSRAMASAIAPVPWCPSQ